MILGKWLKALRKHPGHVREDSNLPVYQYELVSTINGGWVKYWVKSSVWPDQADRADGEIQVKDSKEFEKIFRKKYIARKFTYISDVP